MKSTISFCIAILFVAAAYAQLPPVVSTPIAESLLSTTNTTLTTQASIQTTMANVVQSMEQAEKEYRDAMTKTGWVKNLKSAQRLLSMIENLICTSKTLSLKMSIAGSTCLYSFKYDMMLVKIQMSADYLGIILSAVSMTVAERAQTLAAATKSFEESQFLMVALNNSLDDEIAQSRITRDVTKEVASFMNIDRSKKQ